MRLKVFLAALAAFAVAAFAGWSAMLHWIPYKETDELWNRFLGLSMQENRLMPPLVRSARRNTIPMDNADTMTRATIYDVSEGPVLFEAEVPGEIEYWSVSTYAHNTDTIFVTNDQDTGPGPYRLLIRKEGQAATAPADDVAVSPSDRGFLIVRAVMRDRNDAGHVAKLKADLASSSVQPLSAVEP